jgi:sugar O-acyltransferase (sialic acid O-acetyltransferase NeuD family)
MKLQRFSKKERLGVTVAILGNGGHAKDLCSCFLEKPSLIPYNMDPPRLARLVCGMADTKIRKELIERYGQERFDAAVAKETLISKYSKVGRALQALPGVIVQPAVEIGDWVILNTGCQISHDCAIGDWCFIAPGAVLTGGVLLCENAFVGANATILPNRGVGRNAIVGAGAVVVHDVPDNAIVAGNPAKILRYRRDDE